MPKVSGLIVTNSISERDFLSALDETDLVGGEVYPLVNGRGADVETLRHILPAEIGTEGGEARLFNDFFFFVLLVLMAPATTGGPPGNEHLAALTQHVDEVELTVRVLVLRGSRFARSMSCARDYKI